LIPIVSDLKDWINIAHSKNTITGEQLGKLDYFVAAIPFFPSFLGNVIKKLIELLKKLRDKLRGAKCVDPQNAQKAADKLDEANKKFEDAANSSKKLPGTTDESVTDKLRRYLLDPNHPVGKDKAAWFRKALGFTQDNLDDLARQIKFDPAKAVATKLTEHGQIYEQIIEIVGANGKRIKVLFVWIRNHDGVVRLVTSTPCHKHTWSVGGLNVQRIRLFSIIEAATI
jgi:hypothetical protein